MTTERYELAAERIRQIPKEEAVSLPFRRYFQSVSEFVLLLLDLKKMMENGSYGKLSVEEKKEWNHKLYADILPDQYEESYANPTYAVKELSEDYGQILSFLYAEVRGGIAWVFERKEEYLTILMELFLEVYSCFAVAEAEEGREVSLHELKDILYWYASDYCDVFAADRICDQIDPSRDFAKNIIENADLTNAEYLYSFGEYIGENQIRTAEHLAELPEEVIRKMAEVYTEGYRIGFINTGKDLSKKSVVSIRYVLGFERVIKLAIANFAKMGLKPVIYRAGVSVLTKARNGRAGYYGGIPNPQYDYDHKDDMGLFLNKRFIERKLEVMKHTYEEHKELAAQFAGPAVIETFGEKPFIPEVKEEAVALNEKQEKIFLSYTSKAGQLMIPISRGRKEASRLWLIRCRRLARSMKKSSTRRSGSIRWMRHCTRRYSRRSSMR